jgi:nucleoside-diphosphate-sugar epimerase
MNRTDHIVVTGSSGLIGSALARRLSATYRVTGLDREPSPFSAAGFDAVHLDLLSEKALEACLRRLRSWHGNRIASVIHLAGYCDFAGGPSSQYEVSNVRGTQRLLRALEGFETEQVIYVSTSYVHAPCKRGQQINEDSPLQPKWDYPRSKLAAEQYIASYAPHMRRLTLRIAGVYDDSCHCLPLAQQMKRIYERSALSHVFPGDVLNGQSFLHLDDLLEAIESAVWRRASLPRETTLLLGEPETLSYEERQRQLGRLIHQEEWETQPILKSTAEAAAWLSDSDVSDEPVVGSWRVDGADDHYALDITRARQWLNWEPKRSLRAALPLMVEALKTDARQWYVTNGFELPEDASETISLDEQEYVRM